MPVVTVQGAGGAIVSVNFASSANAALAQAALNQVTGLVQNNTLTQVNFPGGAGSVPAASLLGGVVVTVGGGNFISMPATYAALVNDAAGLTATTATDLGNPTIVSGSNGNLTLTNLGNAASIYLSGGLNNITEGSPTATAQINVDGGTGGVSVTNVNATQGSTEVNMFSGATVNFTQGLISQGAVVSQVGVYGTGDVINVMGSVLSPSVVIDGGSGSFVTVNDQGGTTASYPNSGNIWVNGGPGHDTVFGGNGSVPGLGNESVPVFTGSATVIGGEGYFEGGIAGNNYITAGTVTGGATVVGIGNGDFIASYGASDLIEAGAGNETLASYTGLNAPAGQFFVSGNTPTANTTIYGSAGGYDNFTFETGSSTVFAQHGANGTNGNLFFDFASGGTQTIYDFIPGVDHYSLSDSAVTGSSGSHPTVATDTYYATAGTSPFGAAGTQVVLSDHTTINFVTVNVPSNTFT
jgi:hypothetical protein